MGVDESLAAKVVCRSHIALEGSNLTLFCNATGNPQPDITWTKGDSSVLSSTETLYLMNLRREDNRDLKIRGRRRQRKRR